MASDGNLLLHQQRLYSPIYFTLQVCHTQSLSQLTPYSGSPINLSLSYVLTPLWIITLFSNVLAAVVAFRDPGVIPAPLPDAKDPQQPPPQVIPGILRSGSEFCSFDDSFVGLADSEFDEGSQIPFEDEIMADKIVHVPETPNTNFLMDYCGKRFLLLEAILWMLIF